MLAGLDRIQVVVADLEAAVRAWESSVAASWLHEDAVETLRAHRAVLALGESEIELLFPTGPGPAADHLGAWGPGLFAAGLAVRDMAALRERFAEAGVRWTEEGEQLFLEPGEMRGMRTVLGPARAPRAASGPIERLFEVVHLVRDVKQGADHFSRVLGIAADAVREFDSPEFGYSGRLLSLAPGECPDRIELAQAADPARPMGRFFRRRGEALYLGFATCPDLAALVDRLAAAGARHQLRPRLNGGQELFVHPSALTGVLLGARFPA